jgi:DNA-directed RNA polymerase specialized sigma24 family protein
VAEPLSLIGLRLAGWRALRLQAQLWNAQPRRPSRGHSLCARGPLPSEVHRQAAEPRRRVARTLVPIGRSLLTVDEHDQAAQRRSLLDGFQRHYEDLRHFLRQRLGGQDVAADVLQEVYLRVAGLGPRSHIANTRAYLYKVAAHLVIDHRRACGRSLCVTAGVSELMAHSVTVIEGIVAVSLFSGEAADGAALLLGAGQQVSYAQRRLEQPRTVDLQHITAWQRGLLVFRDTPLARVAAEINRYRPGVILTSPRVADRRVSGVFHLDRPQDALTTIEAALGLRSLHLTNRLVFLY